MKNCQVFAQQVTIMVQYVLWVYPKSTVLYTYVLHAVYCWYCLCGTLSRDLLRTTEIYTVPTLKTHKVYENYAFYYLTSL